MIGWPLAESLSPVFQQAALDDAGVDIRFERIPVEPKHLKEFIGTLRQPEYAGICITAPHKERVVKMADSVHPDARRIGAVNWLINNEGTLEGHNTDGIGFLESLHATGFKPEGQRIVVMGAGGAARAVVHALAGAGAEEVTIWNRTLTRAVALAKAFGTGPCRIMVAESVDSALRREGVGMLVNASSMGMRGANGGVPFDYRHLPPEILGYDLVYAPRVTPFMEAVSRAGAKTVNGLAMLVHQGAAGFRLLTGREAPLQVMFGAIDRYAESAEGGPK